MRQWWVWHCTAVRYCRCPAACERLDWKPIRARRGAKQPGVFGVFLYRSANPRTLAALDDFFPVPAQALTGEFDGGATPEEVCARTIRELRAVGAEKVYVSNLGSRGAGARLRRILELV